MTSEFCLALAAIADHPNIRVVGNVIVALRKAATAARHIYSVRGAGYRVTP